MDIECFSRLSKERRRDLPKTTFLLQLKGRIQSALNTLKALFEYMWATVTGTENPNSALEDLFEVFHEAMHILLLELEKHISYAEKAQADILSAQNF